MTPWVLPNFTMVPPRGDHPIHGHFWVPIDDENCWAWSFDYHPTRELTEQEVSAMKAGAGVHSKNIPGTYRPVANKDNDYLIDRERQKTGELFSGVEGIAIQDSSLQESMGPIVDRTKERLVATDAGIIKARQKLRRAAEALRDHGTEPVGNVRRAPEDPLRRDRPASPTCPSSRASARGSWRARACRRPRCSDDDSRRIRLSACARAATAEEAAYRIDYPLAYARSTRVVAFDDVAAGIVASVASQRVGPGAVLHGVGCGR